MVKLVTSPVDAIIGTLINDFSKAVYNRGLTNGVNIIRGVDYRNFRKRRRDVTAFFDIQDAGHGVKVNRGAYDVFTIKYPITIMAHSDRSRKEANDWIDEAWEIIQDRRKNIGNLYVDYRKIWLEQGPQDVSTATHYKFVISIELETIMLSYNASVYDGGEAVESMPVDIVDGGTL